MYRGKQMKTKPKSPQGVKEQLSDARDELYKRRRANPSDLANDVIEKIGALELQLSKSPPQTGEYVLLSKLEAWCETLDDPSILLGGTYGDYEKANKLLEYAKAESVTLPMISKDKE